MLDFYGITLVDRQTGMLQRASNWQERFAHLNRWAVSNCWWRMVKNILSPSKTTTELFYYKLCSRSSHNYLRITRILKCLGEFGFENLKWPFIQFMLHEIIIYGTLENCFDSCIGFWIMVLRNDNEREQAIELAKVLCDRRCVLTVNNLKLIALKVRPTSCDLWLVFSERLIIHKEPSL